MEVLKSCVLLNFNARLMTAEREILRVKEGAKVDKKGVVLFNPKALNPFQRLKREMFMTARRLGTKLDALGAWLIPLESAEVMEHHIRRLVSAYEAEADSFAARYHELVEEQCEAHPLDADDIRRAAPSASQVRAGLMASCIMYQLPDEIREAGLERELNSLPGQVAGEIAQDIKDSLSPGARYSKATLGVIRRIAAKAESFGFLHASLAALPGLVNQLLARLPPEGPYHGVDALNIGMLLAFLQDPVRLLEEGERLGDGFFAEDLPAAAVPNPVAGPTKAPAAPAAATESLMVSLEDLLGELPSVAPAPPAPTTQTSSEQEAADWF